MQWTLYMCTSVQVKTGAIARLCKCAQGNIGKNINGHRILLISAVQSPLAELLYLSLFTCSFVCTFVRPAMVTSNQISTLFNIYSHKSVVITQFHLISSSCTDPVPTSTNQYRPILTQYHQIPTSTAFY